MEVIIKGTPEEIAALVLELQERQKTRFIPDNSNGKHSSEAACICTPGGLIPSKCD
jgi:hypothetical protein